jgi:hypothetical protein
MLNERVTPSQISKNGAPPQGRASSRRLELAAKEAGSGPLVEAADRRGWMGAPGPAAQAAILDPDDCIPGGWYTANRGIPRLPPPPRLRRPAGRRDLPRRAGCVWRLDRLALRPHAHARGRLGLIVGGVVLRQPGRLRLLRLLPRLGHRRVGERNGVVCEAAWTVAFGTLGAFVRAAPWQARAPLSGDRRFPARRAREPPGAREPNDGARTSRPLPWRSRLGGSCSTPSARSHAHPPIPDGWPLCPTLSAPPLCRPARVRA